MCPTLLLTLATAVTPFAYEAADSVPDMNFNLDELVVTGTRTPRLLKDTPVQTRLITAADISKTDASDIEDLLQQELPGVEFTQAMNQQTHLNLNGFGGQGVLFLVDGERLAGETMDDVDFSRLGMGNVERIEIVRGASSALYGSSAGGGVVNVITRQAQKRWSLNLNGRIGRHNDQRYGISLGNRFGRFRNMLTATYRGMDSYDVSSKANPTTRVISTVYGHRTLDVKEQLAYSPVDGLRLSGRAGYYFKEIPRVDDSPERYRDYAGGLKGNWDITGSDDVEIAYSFDQYDKSTLYRLSGLDIRSYSNVQNSVRIMYNHRFGQGDILTAGADYMHDYLMNRNLDGTTRRQHCADVFVQYDWLPHRLWEVVGAARYDYFSDGHQQHVTPKISVRYRPLSGLNLRLSYGMGFRAPSLKEKYYDFDMAGIWIVNGNPALKPERSHSVNLSADYTRGRYNVTLSAYYNNVSDKISTGVPYYRPGDDRQLYLDYLNLRRYSVAGGEAAVQASCPCGLSARAAYAYTDETVAKDRSGNVAANQYMPARRHSLNARIDWDKRWNDKYALRLSLNGRYMSGVDNTEYIDYYDLSAGTVRVHYPAYFICKLSAVQRIWDAVSVTVAVDNLFNYKPDYYYLNSPLTDGINLMVGVSIDFDRLI